MDVYQNAEVPSAQATAGFQAEMNLPFLPGEQTGEDEASLEWLSMFMEDCLSTTPIPTTTTTTSNPPSHPPIQPSLQHPRGKRKRFNPRTQQSNSHDSPLLLHQTHHWLADSELILPKKEPSSDLGGGGDEEMMVKKEEETQQPRRCSHCHSHKTPQWRAGPLGPKTLCNACGVRFKSGRLLPEYRPAKSPTFVRCKHSNSHKKIMEMRMVAPPSPSRIKNESV